MPFETLSNLPARELIPGFRGRMVHTDHMTFSYWEVAAGAELPEHAHPHEQITALLEGRFEMTVNGVTEIVEPGMIVVIPGHAPHSGKALTACRIYDVFSPVRADYRDAASG